VPHALLICPRTYSRTVGLRQESLTYGLFDPEHCGIDRDLSLLLYCNFFSLSELFQFTTDGKEQDDCLHWRGDEVEKLTIRSATTALNLDPMYTHVIVKAINVYEFGIRFD
jgi:hypothetical protein